jgi:hypothetical protein
MHVNVFSFETRAILIVGTFDNSNSCKSTDRIMQYYVSSVDLERTILYYKYTGTGFRLRIVVPN